MVLLDSKSTQSGTISNFHDSFSDGGKHNNLFLIQNLVYDTTNAIALDSSNNSVKLAVTHKIDTGTGGNITSGQHETEITLPTSRPDVLLSHGKYFIRSQPTYAGMPQTRWSFKAFDGSTDDVSSLNANLLDNAANYKISYLRYGVCIVQDTLKIPVGSHIAGKAWTVIFGAGDIFKDASNSKPVVRTGRSGNARINEIQERWGDSPWRYNCRGQCCSHKPWECCLVEHNGDCPWHF